LLKTIRFFAYLNIHPLSCFSKKVEKEGAAVKI
jgi:hypothetical protein